MKKAPNPRDHGVHKLCKWIPTFVGISEVFSLYFSHVVYVICVFKQFIKSSITQKLHLPGHSMIFFLPAILRTPTKLNVGAQSRSVLLSWRNASCYYWKFQTFVPLWTALDLKSSIC